MQKCKFWNSFYLSFRKITFTLLLLLAVLQSFAQDERMNNPEHDDKPYYFGITLGFNSAQYKLQQSKYFIDYDSVKNITPLWKPGFHEFI